MDHTRLSGNEPPPVVLSQTKYCLTLKCDVIQCQKVEIKRDDVGQASFLVRLRIYLSSYIWRTYRRLWRKTTNQPTKPLMWFFYPEIPNTTCHSWRWPHAVTRSIDQILLQLWPFYRTWPYYRILNELHEVSVDHLPSGFGRSTEDA